MRTIEEFRERLLEQTNHAVRRPGMFGGELPIRFLLGDLTFIDEADEAWNYEQQQLRDRGSWTEIGVPGAFATIFGGRQQGTHDAAVGSVYAEIAHRLGYLRLDNTLTTSDYRQLRREARPWSRAGDRSLSDVIETFGEPGIRCGGNGAFWPATIAYVTTSSSDPLICFDAWNEVDNTGTRVAGRWGPEPVLRNVRIRTSAFPRDFTYTPIGKIMRQRTDYPLQALRGAPVPR